MDVNMFEYTRMWEYVCVCTLDRKAIELVGAAILTKSSRLWKKQANAPVLVAFCEIINLFDLSRSSKYHYELASVHQCTIEIIK